MIVVDVNVIAYRLIEGQHTPQARRVQEHDPQWIAPEVWRHEFLNILANYVRFDGMPRGHAVMVWRQARLLMAAAERPVDAGTVLDLAAEASISAYDAQYVELAQRLRARLVTGDLELVRKFPALACTMETFCRGT